MKGIVFVGNKIGYKICLLMYTTTYFFMTIDKKKIRCISLIREKVNNTNI